MAAAAYDVAVLALKREDAVLNFPGSIKSYPVPASMSALDIRAVVSVAGEFASDSGPRGRRRGCLLLSLFKQAAEPESPEKSVDNKDPQQQFIHPGAHYMHHHPAATVVAAAATLKTSGSRGSTSSVGQQQKEYDDMLSINSSSALASSVGADFMDEEEIFGMPNLLVDMAEGMLVSPPRINSPRSDYDSPEYSDGGESLWNYD
ncbi:hypothetical protein ACLB2K_011188 [Fragaria x ananassa]